MICENHTDGMYGQIAIFLYEVPSNPSILAISYELE